MALYHFHVGQIGRSKGHSAIAAAAYRAGQKLYDDYYGETQDYTHKGGVIYEEIMLPPNAPARYADRQTLWNEVERCEKHPKAQLAYSFDIALQNELTREENIALARQFIKDNFVAKGMICDWTVHEPDKKGGIPNPHFHVLIPMRPLKKNGEWDAKQRREYRLDTSGERIRDGRGRYVFNAVPTTDWGSPETLDSWRYSWAAYVNMKFFEKGLACRIDNKSYKKRGIEAIPQIHEGSSVRRMEKKGMETDKGNWNRWIRKANAKLQSLMPAIRELREWVEWAKAVFAEMKESAPAPSIALQVSEYYKHRNEVANAYKYGAQKAKISNLKSHAHVEAYIEEKNIRTVDDVDRQISIVGASLKVIDESVKPLNEKISVLSKYMGYIKDYERFQPIYKESRRIFFKARKKAYQEEHRKELNSFHRAKRELEKIGRADDIEVSRALCKKDIEKTKQQLEKKLSESGRDRLEDEIGSLKIIRKAVEYCMGQGDQSNNGKENGKGIAGAGRRTPENAATKKSFQDILDDKSAEADRINAGRTENRNTPIRGRYER